MKQKPYVIGIAGGSASGKTTFSAKLEKELASLRVKTLHMDSYFKPRDARPQSPAPISGKIYMDDNHPLTMDLNRFAADLRAAIECGEWQVIIAEGLLVLWDEAILAQLDLKLFVDCRADERIVRRIRRNSKWNQTCDEITDVYLDLVRFRHDEYVEPTRWRADLILNGSAPSDAALHMIAQQAIKYAN